jgi:hypothetical protein
MMDDLLSFVAPVVAEFEAEVPSGWRVTSAKVEGFVRFSMIRTTGKVVDYSPDVPAPLRWWIGSHDVYGATFAEAVGKARAQGWTP